MKNGKEFVVQFVKVGVLSFVISCAFVLILALVAKLFTIDGKSLSIVNQICKIIAICIGTSVSVSNDKILWKCALGVVVYSLLSALMFIILGGTFNFGQVILDFALALVASVVVGILKAKRQ